MRATIASWGAILLAVTVSGSVTAARETLQASPPKRPSVRNTLEKKSFMKFRERVRAQALAHPGTLFLEAPGDDKRIALTFDDGPDKKYTPIILAMLKKHDVRATFFMRGRRVRNHPDLVARVSREGHAIGMHSLTHTMVHRLTAPVAFEREIGTMGDLFFGLIGLRPAIYRPPYGLISDEQIDFFAARGVKSIVWSVDSFDWHPRFMSANGIAKTVLKYAHPGAIVLMHDACNRRCYTARALETIILALKKQGYRFLTVPDLLGIPGATDQ